MNNQNQDKISDCNQTEAGIKMEEFKAVATETMKMQEQDQCSDLAQTEAAHKIKESEAGATETMEAKKQDVADHGAMNPDATEMKKEHNIDNEQKKLQYVTLTGNEDDYLLILLYQYGAIDMELFDLRVLIQSAYQRVKAWDVRLDVLLLAWREAEGLNAIRRPLGLDPIRSDETSYGPFSRFAMRYPLNLPQDMSFDMLRDML